MEGGESERASSYDESDEEENGLQNAYSVGDLLGELSSDNDTGTVCDGNNSVSTVQDPHDYLCPDSNLSMNNVSNITPEKRAGLKANSALEEVLECHATPETGAHSTRKTGVAIPFLETYSHVYDEVLTDNVYHDPVERDDCFVKSK